MKCAIEVRLRDGPLPRPAPFAAPGAGAVLAFEGVVRLLEAGRELDALVYEAYEPMTSRELSRLAERVASRHGLLAVRVEHSTGRVAVGEASFRLSVASPHRAAALAATTEFIDEMKQSVPLWKTPAYRAGRGEA